MTVLPEIAGIRLTSFLAAGGWGEVYDGLRLSDDKPVAVKLLHDRLTQDATAVQRMTQEGRLCWSLDHPNVIRVLESGQTSTGRVFIVMERLHGLTVEALIRRDGPLPAAAVVAVARGIAAGLKAIHRRAVHRDIKPSNIFLCAERPEASFVKLLDLGIASLHPDDPNRMVHTEVGEIVGTPAYVAPERFRGEPSTPSIDIYAFGATLFECATGAPPYVGPPLAVAVQVCRAKTAPPLPRKDFPEALRTLVTRMLAPDPRDRPATCDEILLLLERVEDTLEVELWTATHRAPSVSLHRTSEHATSFTRAALDSVHQHFHPDHIPEEIADRLRVISETTEALATARRQVELSEQAAAELACGLERAAAEIALRCSHCARQLASAEAELDALRQSREGLTLEIRDLDRVYEAQCAELSIAFQAAMAAAHSRSEPIDASSAEGDAGRAAIERIDATVRAREGHAAVDRALALRIEKAGALVALRATTFSQVGQALAAVETDRRCRLGLMERAAREAEEVALRLAHDRHLVHLDLGVALQRMALG